MTQRDVVLHGHRMTYRGDGEGPVLLLLHGIAGSSATWNDVLPWLAERYCVVAPDLLGHGESAKPRGDYSLGAYASAVRDLMGVLGHHQATVVGHSLGGGVAMQLAYQFPERCERLVLVSSGGLGREVHPILRAAALPGAEYVLPLLCSAGLRDAVDSVARALGRVGLRAGADLDEMWRGFCSLGDADTRQAFVHTLQTIIDPGGQRVHAGDRLYLASEIPTMLVWGDEDPVIPIAHGRAAHEAIAGSRFEVFPHAGHFPHRDDPRRFVEVMLDFLATTTPAHVTEERWQERLRSGA
ncbi:MAG TPA: alpha/beta fold hydrolase [Candidatus Binatia bacterium]|jgi:pimeloyl-ACP methyl ester carboxylesterase|nr:alpha/beta fold hydrolase [Candidatus Binatia bacterium]